MGFSSMLQNDYLYSYIKFIYYNLHRKNVFAIYKLILLLLPFIDDKDQENVI